MQVIILHSCEVRRQQWKEKSRRAETLMNQPGKEDKWDVGAMLAMRHFMFYCF